MGNILSSYHLFPYFQVVFSPQLAPMSSYYCTLNAPLLNFYAPVNHNKTIWRHACNLLSDSKSTASQRCIRVSSNAHQLTCILMHMPYVRQCRSFANLIRVVLQIWYLLACLYVAGEANWFGAVPSSGVRHVVQVGWYILVVGTLWDSVHLLQHESSSFH